MRRRIRLDKRPVNAQSSAFILKSPCEPALLTGARWPGCLYRSVHGPLAASSRLPVIPVSRLAARIVIAGRHGKIALLLDRAVAAGEIRNDVSAEDLLRTLVGMCLLHDQPGWQVGVVRMLDVLIDGMRVKAASPAERRPSKPR